MEHRGYTGSVKYDPMERIFYGEVMDLGDTITYEAISEERLECAFRDAVDEYIDQCYACEEEPERPPARRDVPDAGTKKRAGRSLPARLRRTSAPRAPVTPGAAPAPRG